MYLGVHDSWHPYQSLMIRIAESSFDDGPDGDNIPLYIVYSDTGRNTP